MNLFNDGKTLKFLSRRGHKNQLRKPIDDWESFLYSMCFISFLELGWFFGYQFDGMQTEEALTAYGLKKEQTNVTVCTQN